MKGVFGILILMCLSFAAEAKLSAHLDCDKWADDVKLVEKQEGQMRFCEIVEMPKGQPKSADFWGHKVGDRMTSYLKVDNQDRVIEKGYGIEKPDTFYQRLYYSYDNFDRIVRVTYRTGTTENSDLEDTNGTMIIEYVGATNQISAILENDGRKWLFPLEVSADGNDDWEVQSFMNRLGRYLGHIHKGNSTSPAGFFSPE